MAFMRKKEIKGGVYYQLVENRRVGGKPRQKVLLHLGQYPTVDDALQAWPKEIVRLRDRARENREDFARRAAGQVTSPASLQRVLERAEHADRQGDALEAKLKKLRDLRRSGTV